MVDRQFDRKLIANVDVRKHALRPFLANAFALQHAVGARFLRSHHHRLWIASKGMKNKGGKNED